MGYSGVGLGWIWLLILLAGLVTLIYGLVLLRASSLHRRAARQRGRSRDLLRLRYARGEISEEEMDEGMRDLDGP